jgi:hypothetical protein
LIGHWQTDTLPLMDHRLLFGFALVAAACSTPSSGTAAPDSVTAVCQAQCDRSARCRPDASTAVAGCVADCAGGFAPQPIFRPGVLSSIAGCLSGLQCGVSDDGCTTQAVVAQNPNWQLDPAFNACLAKKSECQAGGAGSFSDDNCIAVFLTTDAVAAAFNACIAGACSTIDACITSVIGP